MRLAALTLATLIATTPMAIADTFSFDPGHTQVRASWNHVGFSEQSVHFRKVEGTLEFDPDNISNTSVNVTIDLNSLDTGVEDFNGHLKSADFFGIADNASATFVSTGIEKTGDMTAKLTGDLTIKGVTKPVTLDVTVNSYGEHPLGQFVEYNKGTWIGATLTGTVTRSDWGLGAFAPAVSDEVTLFISSEMKAQ